MNIYSVIFLLIPFISIAQIDYCPCEEEVNNSNDLMNLVSSINNQIGLMVPGSIYSINTRNVQAKTQHSTIPEKKRESPQKLNASEVTTPKSSLTPAIDKTNRKRKSKSLFRKKRLKRKRLKRYKGQCPFFKIKKS
jgi:hypothetical protein